MKKKTADTSKVENKSRHKTVPPFTLMNDVKSAVHPSLGRRGIVVPYDIPKQEKCPRCGK